MATQSPMPRARTASVIAALDETNRRRSLTDEESDRLYWAIMQERRNAQRQGRRRA